MFAISPVGEKPTSRAALTCLSLYRHVCYKITHLISTLEMDQKYNTIEGNHGNLPGGRSNMRGHHPITGAIVATRHVRWCGASIRRLPYQGFRGAHGCRRSVVSLPGLSQQYTAHAAGQTGAAW